MEVMKSFNYCDLFAEPCRRQSLAPIGDAM